MDAHRLLVYLVQLEIIKTRVIAMQASNDIQKMNGETGGMYPESAFLDEIKELSYIQNA